VKTKIKNKNMEKFKSKKEAQKAFEQNNIEYPKFISGANKGKIKGSLDSLTNIYHSAIKKHSKKPIAEKKKVIKKVVFHRGRPLKFNSFLFKKQ